jgi:hypothetical protein
MRPRCLAALVGEPSFLALSLISSHLVAVPSYIEMEDSESIISERSIELDPAIAATVTPAPDRVAALAIVSGRGKTPLLILQPLPLLMNHCHRTYRNCLIGKV